MVSVMLDMVATGCGGRKGRCMRRRAGLRSQSEVKEEKSVVWAWLSVGESVEGVVRGEDGKRQSKPLQLEERKNKATNSACEARPSTWEIMESRPAGRHDPAARTFPSCFSSSTTYSACLYPECHDRYQRALYADECARLSPSRGNYLHAQFRSNRFHLNVPHHACGPARLPTCFRAPSTAISGLGFKHTLCLQMKNLRRR